MIKKAEMKNLYQEKEQFQILHPLPIFKKKQI